MHPSNVMERRGAAMAADLRLLGAADLLALDLPPRESVIGPALVRGSVTLLRGGACLGKSWLALSLAYAAAAGGSACGWAAPRPARVLYADAQMPLALLQARLAAIARFAECAAAPDPRPSSLDKLGTRGSGRGPGGEGRGERAAPAQDEVVIEAGPARRRARVRRRGMGPDDAAAAAAPAIAPAAPPPVPATLRLLAGEAQALPMPDLAQESGRAALTRLLFEAEGEGGAAPVPAFDLVVLDGLSALLRGARGRNDPAREFAEFLSALRRAGLCVLLVDRARPRRRMAPPYEDILDATITVKRPPGLGDDGAAHMALALAGRAFAGSEQFELRLVLEPEAGEAPGWRRVARLDALMLAAWRLERRGLSYRAMARELDVSAATAWRLCRKAAALDPDVLEAAAAEMDGDVLPPEDETAATVEIAETPETPEPPRDSPDWIAWTVDRLCRDGRDGPDGPDWAAAARAARDWVRLLAALRAPPGVFLQGRHWQQVDRALHDRLKAALAPARAAAP